MTQERHPVNGDRLIEVMAAGIHAGCRKDLLHPELWAAHLDQATCAYQALTDKGATHILMKDGTAVPLDGGEAVEGGVVLRRFVGAKGAQGTMSDRYVLPMCPCGHSKAEHADNDPYDCRCSAAPGFKCYCPKYRGPLAAPSDQHRR